MLFVAKYTTLATRWDWQHAAWLHVLPVTTRAYSVNGLANDGINLANVGFSLLPAIEDKAVFFVGRNA